MEYYIMKVYKDEKEKCPDIQNGFNQYDSKAKKGIIICFVKVYIKYGIFFLIVIIICFVEMILGGIIETLSMPLQWKLIWQILGVILLIVAVLSLLIIENKNEKKYMNNLIQSHNKKIELLDNILKKDEFQINTKEKIENLICIYQDYIDKKNEEEKERNRIIFMMASAVAGILTISFENMVKIGINFSSWLYLAAILLIFTSIGGLWIYAYKYFESLKVKYESLIKDLKDVFLMKY